MMNKQIGFLVLCSMLAAQAIQLPSPRKAGGLPLMEALHKMIKLKPSQPVAAVWADGVYAGKAGGYAGTVRVAVTIEGGRIADVEITGHREPRARKAIQEIPRRIVRANSPSVDAFSGATITSGAIIGAVKNALDEAQ